MSAHCPERLRPVQFHAADLLRNDVQLSADSLRRVQQGSEYLRHLQLEPANPLHVELQCQPELLRRMQQASQYLRAVQPSDSERMWSLQLYSEHRVSRPKRRTLRHLVRPTLR
jgi:hypothetical protein